MPPERPPSTPSPSKKRKAQNVAGNASLVTFFRKASRRPPPAESSNHSRHASCSKDGIEDDEAVALKLAAEEGLDVEAMKALEQKWKPDQDSPSKRPAHEIINLDSSDDGSDIFPAHNMKQNDRKISPRKLPGPARSMVSNKGQYRESTVEDAPFPSLIIDPIYFSVMNCPWSRSSSSTTVPTPYSFLAYTLSSLSATKSRTAILNILTNFLRFIIHHDPSSLLHSLYLLSNSLAPPYTLIELGLGPSIISKAIQQVSGLTPAALKRLYTKFGDAGDVAFEAKSNIATLVPHPSLTVSGVYTSLLKICNAKGDGAMRQKQSIAEKLLISAKGEEIRYLVRTMSQHIRVGAVRTSLLTAFARALVLTRPLTCETLPADDSPYFVSTETLCLVEEVSRKGRKKEEENPIRTQIMKKWSDAEALLKRVYVQHPNFNHIADAVLEGGLEELADRVKLTVGIPLHPTLGSPTRSLDEVYDRLGDLPFTAEFKYDGQRAQIHGWRREGGDLLIHIFSRHLEEMTDKYPDITSLVEEIFEASSQLRSFIIDTEIVAVDASDGSLRTFQELSNRARKDVRLEEVKIKVCIFAFDLMYLNGETLIEQPFRVRRQKLWSYFPPIIPGSPNVAKFDHVECCESEAGREKVEGFWRKAVEGRSEGLMIKLLDSGDILQGADDSKGKRRRKPLPATYEPGKSNIILFDVTLAVLITDLDKRTSAWLKLKKDYVLSLGDSLDLVPIGAWHGNGRKAAWWSPILLAVWDENIGRLVGVCKCMSGFTDEFYKSLNERYPENSETCSRTSLWEVNTGSYTPEWYFRPQEVWEIRGADITLSPVSAAALGLISRDRGLSLRFPRFIRIREDKGIADASTPDFLAAMWRKQESRGKNAKGIDDGDLVDVSPEISEVEDEEDDG